MQKFKEPEKSKMAVNYYFNNNFRCRKETARCFVSLKIILFAVTQNYSRSFKFTPLSRTCVSYYQHSVISYNFVSILYRLWAILRRTKIGVSLKYGLRLGVAEDHSK